MQIVADLTARGEYVGFLELGGISQVKAFYSVEINSRKLPNIETKQLMVLNSTSAEGVFPEFLQMNVKYFFMCESHFYPFPELQLQWHSVCNNSKINSKENNKTTHQFVYSVLTDTHKKVVYFEAKPIFSGILVCITKDSMDVAVEKRVIVSDIKDAQNNYGVRLDILDPNPDEGIVEGDNITVQLLLQKEYTSVICVFVHSNCPHDDQNCYFKVLKAIARNYSATCLEFVSDWNLLPPMRPDVDIYFDTSNAYSNSFYIQLKNVSRLTYHGLISCIPDKLGLVQLDTRHNPPKVDLDILEPRHPWFYLRPKAVESYRINDTVEIFCGGSGTLLPNIEWFHNGYTVNSTVESKVLNLKDYFNHTSHLKFKINKTDDFGEYCCKLFNKFATKESCVKINPIDDINVGAAQVIIFTILSITAILFHVITPLSFVRRRKIAEKVRSVKLGFFSNLKNFHIVLVLK